MSTPDLERGVIDLHNFLRDHFFGKYRGTVKEVDQQTARIKAAVPAIYGTGVSPWAMPCLPFAGKKHGVAFLPEVDDGVWIEFEAGDPDVPIWSGFWWGDNEMPDSLAENVRGIITSEGLEFILDDKNKEIKLVHPGGAEIKLTQNDITIKIGQKSIKLSSSGINMNDGALEVK
jgi:hypothetical protein